MTQPTFDHRSYVLGYTDATKQWGLCDRRFSSALFRAAECRGGYGHCFEDSYEMVYALNKYTSVHERVCELNYTSLLHRQIFLQLAALSMKDEGL